MIGLPHAPQRDRVGIRTLGMAELELSASLHACEELGWTVRTILDLGTGKGHFLTAAVQREYFAVGIDIRNVRLDGAPGYVIADAKALPIAPGSIDLVHSHLTIDDVISLQGRDGDVPRIVCQIAEALRPGGVWYSRYDNPPSVSVMERSRLTCIFERNSEMCYRKPR